MFTRTLLLIALLNQVSACIATPRIELAQRIDFNYLQPDQAPLSYNDLLCCYDCTA